MNCLLDGCFKIVPYTNQENYVVIKDGEGCSSSLGMRGRDQFLTLKRGSCVYHSTVQHEFLHAAGIWHEQSRQDRDDYIDILWDNIQDWAKFNFDKQGFNAPEVKYNINSVMQYKSTAFTKNGKDTIRRKDGKKYRQNNHGVTEQDLEKIKIMYKCNGNSFPWQSCPYPCTDLLGKSYCSNKKSCTDNKKQWYEAECMKFCDACGDGPLYTPTPRQCKDPDITNYNSKKRCDVESKGYLGAGHDMDEFDVKGGCQGCVVSIDECRQRCVDHGWCAGWTYQISQKSCWLKTWGYNVNEDEKDEDWIIGLCPEEWEIPITTTTEDPWDTTLDPCENRDEKCEEYGLRRCTLNEGWKKYMDQNCPATCHEACGGGGSCKDKDKDCEGYGKDKKCCVWPDWMKENCPMTCGHCNGIDNCVCEDMNKEDCAKYKKVGYCKEPEPWAKWMKIHCEKTCGHC